MREMPDTAIADGARSEARLSIVLALVPVLAVFALGALVLGNVGGPRPPFLDGNAVAVARPHSDASEALVLAGSGSNLPVTRELAAGFASIGALQPVVHVSLGSGGSQGNSLSFVEGDGDGSFGARVRFDNRDDDVDTLAFQGVGVFEHLPRLANTGRSSDINAQRRLVACSELREQCFG